MGLRSTNC